MYECCICYTKKYVTKTNCNHEICINCLMNLVKLKCPLCRKDLSNELPKNLLNYLKERNNYKKEKRPIYMRLNDIEEFPSLP